jgi:hypothetical protein
MDTLDIEFEFEHRKRKVLAKIEKLKEKWQAMWERCIGDPQAEASAVQARLDIQLMETEALDELEKLKRKIDIIRDKVKESDEPEACE